MNEFKLYIPSPRPMTGILVPIIRNTTPRKIRKKSSSKSCREKKPAHFSLSKSPYKKNLIKQKPKTSTPIKTIQTTESLQLTA